MADGVGVDEGDGDGSEDDGEGSEDTEEVSDAEEEADSVDDGVASVEDEGDGDASLDSAVEDDATDDSDVADEEADGSDEGDAVTEVCSASDADGLTPSLTLADADADAAGALDAERFGTHRPTFCGRAVAGRAETTASAAARTETLIVTCWVIGVAITLLDQVVYRLPESSYRGYRLIRREDGRGCVSAASRLRMLRGDER